ncbi:Uncharacterised protein [Roseomonas gilardii subsp. rosea]|nr:Uncharacterised protein [Roseomonas gilardii subsp. rosea]
MQTSGPWSSEPPPSRWVSACRMSRPWNGPCRASRPSSPPFPWPSRQPRGHWPSGRGIPRAACRTAGGRGLLCRGPASLRRPGGRAPRGAGAPAGRRPFRRWPGGSGRPAARLRFGGAGPGGHTAGGGFRRGARAGPALPCDGRFLCRSGVAGGSLPRRARSRGGFPGPGAPRGAFRGLFRGPGTAGGAPWRCRAGGCLPGGRAPCGGGFRGTGSRAVFRFILRGGFRRGLPGGAAAGPGLLRLRSGFRLRFRGSLFRLRGRHARHAGTAPGLHRVMPPVHQAEAPAAVLDIPGRPLGEMPADIADDPPHMLQRLLVRRGIAATLQDLQDPAAGMMADRLRLALVMPADLPAFRRVEPAAHLLGRHVHQLVEGAADVVGVLRVIAHGLPLFLPPGMLPERRGGNRGCQGPSAPGSARPLSAGSGKRPLPSCLRAAASPCRHRG